MMAVVTEEERSLLFKCYATLSSTLSLDTTFTHLIEGGIFILDDWDSLKQQVTRNAKAHFIIDNVVRGNDGFTIFIRALLATKQGHLAREMAKTGFANQMDDAGNTICKEIAAHGFDEELMNDDSRWMDSEDLLVKRAELSDVTRRILLYRGFTSISDSKAQLLSPEFDFNKYFHEIPPTEACAFVRLVFNRIDDSDVDMSKEEVLEECSVLDHWLTSILNVNGWIRVLFDFQFITNFDQNKLRREDRVQQLTGITEALKKNHRVSAKQILQSMCKIGNMSAAQLLLSKTIDVSTTHALSTKLTDHDSTQDGLKLLEMYRYEELLHTKAQELLSGVDPVSLTKGCEVVGSFHRPLLLTLQYTDSSGKAVDKVNKLSSDKLRDSILKSLKASGSKKNITVQLITPFPANEGTAATGKKQNKSSSKPSSDDLINIHVIRHIPFNGSTQLQGTTSTVVRIMAGAVNPGFSPKRLVYWMEPKPRGYSTGLNDTEKGKSHTGSASKLHAEVSIPKSELETSNGTLSYCYLEKADRSNNQSVHIEKAAIKNISLVPPSQRYFAVYNGPIVRFDKRRAVTKFVAKVIETGAATNEIEALALSFPTIPGYAKISLVNQFVEQLSALKPTLGEITLPKYGEMIKERVLEEMRHFVTNSDKASIFTSPIRVMVVLYMIHEYQVGFQNDDIIKLLPKLIPQKDTLPLLHVLKNFHGTRRLGHSLVDFYRENFAELFPWCLFCLPLIHLIREDIKQFAEAPLIFTIENCISDEWWGVSCVPRFKMVHMSIHEKDVITSVCRAGNIDNLIWRSVAQSFDAESFLKYRLYEKMPSEVTLAYICRACVEIQDLQICNLLIKQSLSHLVEQSHKMSKGESQSPGIWVCSGDPCLRNTFCLSVFNQLMALFKPRKHNDNEEMIYETQLLIVKAWTSVLYITGEQIHGKESQQKIALFAIKQWMMEYYSAAFDRIISGQIQTFQIICTMLEKRLRFSGTLAALQWTSTDCTTFRTALLERVDRFFSRMTVDTDKTLRFYCGFDPGNISSEVFEIFEKTVIRKVHEKANQGDSTIFLDLDNQKRTARLVKVLSQIIEDTMPAGPDEEVLQHTLNWPVFSEYVTFFGESDTRPQPLEAAMTVMKSTIESLDDGTINMEALYILKKNRCDAESIFQEINPHLAHTCQNKGDEDERREYIIQLFNYRMDQYDLYTVLRQKVQKLGQFLSSLKELDWVNEILTRLEDITTNPTANSFCVKRFGLEDKLSDTELYTGIFNLGEELGPMIDLVLAWKGSLKFVKMLKKSLKGINVTKPQTPRDFYVNYWTPLEAKFRNYIAVFTEGRITIKKAKKLDKFYKCYDRNITADMRLHESPQEERDELIEARLTEFRILRQSAEHMETLNAMNNLRDVYELEADFTAVSNLSEKSDQYENTELRMVKESDQDVLDMLSDLNITERERECIWAFSQCKHFYDWILEERQIKDAAQANTFVTMVKNTASNQDDLAMERASSLNKALLCFQPMLYRNLENAKTFPDVLSLLKDVWKKLHDFPNLPDILRETQASIHHLDKLADIHGSIEGNEKNILSEINMRGIFTIKMPEKTTNIDLREIINVHINSDGDEETSSPKEYSFEELQDLQNRLQMISKNSDDLFERELNRFMELLEGVQSLGHALIKLIMGGNLWFSESRFQFFCHRSNESSMAIITLGPRFKYKNLKAESALDTTRQLQDVTKFLVQGADAWAQYVAKHRDKYHELNYFSTLALVILQKQLTLLKESRIDGVSDAFEMITNIMNDCTHQDLSEAYKKASELLCDEDRLDEIIKLSDNEDEALKEKKRDFLATLDIYPRQLRLEAMKAVESLDPDDGLMWCEEHFDEEQYSMQQDRTDHNMDDEGREAVEALKLDSLDLDEQLQKFWQALEKKIYTSFTDFLSLEQVGLFLQCLKGLGNRIGRHLPSTFKEGEPNLILCSPNQMLPVLLTIYMEGDGRQKPLPRSDEILFCSKYTTPEEVDIFWRRAIGDTTGRLYSLCCADLLSYAASQKIERNKDKKRFSSKDYKMVVICSSGNKANTHIENVLNNHSRATPEPAPIETIRSYLAQKFRVSEDSIKSAATIDPQRSSVRLASSDVPGNGKTHLACRLFGKLKTSNPEANKKVLSFQSEDIDYDYAVEALLKRELPVTDQLKFIHIDVGQNVRKDSKHFLLNLILLGSVKEKSGKVWVRSVNDFYLIEALSTLGASTRENDIYPALLRSLSECVPRSICYSPRKSHQKLQDDAKFLLVDTSDQFRETDQTSDVEEIDTDLYLRPFHYLTSQPGLYESPDRKLDLKGVLECIIKECGLGDPSWSEIKHFASFLDHQLKNAEQFVLSKTKDSATAGRIMNVIAKFVINMSKDFSTRSLDIAEGEGWQKHAADTDIDIKLRKWETSSYPYVFFNIQLDRLICLGITQTVDGKLTTKTPDEETNQLLVELDEAFKLIEVDLRFYLGNHSRADFLQQLRDIIGQPTAKDPDKYYELTEDNVKKMVAIYMRIKCGMPVIIMGETGCGKTKLIKYLCDLMKPAECAKNMEMLKVHGGIEDHHVYEKLKQANNLSEENNKNANPPIPTILFFDEANTTKSIGLIKEIMCDQMKDERLRLHVNLSVIAACNPYRRHSDEMINRLQKAALGYSKKARTKKSSGDGRDPMCYTVYQVRPLPKRLISVVWDFGTLSEESEKLYIRKMVQSKLMEMCQTEGQNFMNLLPSNGDTIAEILSKSQTFMRNQKGESSIASLRDIERTLRVFQWFYGKQPILFPDTPLTLVDRFKSALVLALAVCYQARLEDDTRKQYRAHISQYFTNDLCLEDGLHSFYSVVDEWQTAFLSEATHVIKTDIAKNNALKENLFMMVICIELKIPLFLVGKPGSSKSLAKTIVNMAMQGSGSRTKIFRNLKMIQMLTYQCSAASTPDSIKKIFDKCSNVQKKENLERFCAVPVLDEIGLAENSKEKPLKALHSLLEDGLNTSLHDEREEYQKFPFIGLSNWPLDPAKMNRGVMVLRGVPDKKELIITAEGICEGSTGASHLSHLIKLLADAYLEVYEKAFETGGEREFFGLRDFYCMIKHLKSCVEEHNREPTEDEIQQAVMRNFSGLKELDVWSIFKRKLLIDRDQAPKAGTNSFTMTLIKSCLKLEQSDRDGIYSEQRHLLLLTENYAALTIIRELLNDDCVIVFGSKFPQDQRYAEICRNIKKIRDCMEWGKTVVLLNLINYESLYDVLNGYFEYLGGQPFVDLGLGTQRVKCKVHPDFRLVLIAEKQQVYDDFEVPLINRMEKHFVTMDTVLDLIHFEMKAQLYAWTDQILQANCNSNGLQKGDIFIGFNEDTIPASLYQTTCRIANRQWDKVLETCKEKLLQTCTPDAIVRLKGGLDHKELQEIYNVYFNKQQHENLAEFLQHEFKNAEANCSLLAQATTHSTLLTKSHVREIAKSIEDYVAPKDIRLIDMQFFETEQQFRTRLRLHARSKRRQVLILQFSQKDQAQELIACAKHCVMEELKGKSLTNVAFVIQLQRIAGGTFKSSMDAKWIACHIDELSNKECSIPSIDKLRNITVAELFLRSLQPKDEDEDAVVDLTPLITRNIHHAAKMLTDDEQFVGRKLKRLKKLLLLRIEGSEWCEVMKKRITQIFKRKESEPSSLNNDWLQKYVASSEAMDEAGGTFRRSLMVYLERIVRPQLAAIIACIDTNNNLDTFQPSKSCSWLDQLWIELFRSEQFVEIRDIQMVDGGELAQFSVKTIGYEDKPFIPRCPFSWIIKRDIDDALQRSQGKDLDTLIMERKYQGIIHKYLTDKERRNEFAQRYLHDFLHLVYAGSKITDEEMQMMVDGLWNDITSVESIEVSVLDVHERFSRLDERLNLFGQIVSSSPELMDKIEHSSVLKGSKLMCLDIKAAYCMLSTLEAPTFSDFAAIKAWFLSVEKCLPFIEKMVNIMDSEATQSFSDEAFQKAVHEFKLKWNRISTVHLYIKHMLSPGQDLRVTPLWRFLGEKSDFTNKKSLETVEKFMNINNRKERKKAEECFKACANCKQQISAFIKTPCNDRCCKHCVEFAIESGRKCPLCEDLYPVQMPMESMALESLDNDPYIIQYRKRMHSFYLDFITTICLSHENSINSDMCDWILEFVTGQKSLTDQTPEECLVNISQPTLLALLQLLIRKCASFVYDYIRRHLKESQDERKTNFVMQRYVYCKEMVTQHYETIDGMETIVEGIRRYMSDYDPLIGLDDQSEAIGSDDAAGELETSMSSITDREMIADLNSDILMKRFDAIPMLKLYLSEFAHVICGGCSSHEEQGNSGVIAETFGLLGANSAVFPRLFFIRLLERKLGTSALQKLKEDYDVNWIDAHERPNPQVNESEVPLWRFRQEISIESLRHSLTSHMGHVSRESERGVALRRLELLLEEEHVLKHVRHLPCVLKLVNYFMTRYDRNMTRASAKSNRVCTILSYISDDRERKDVTDMFDQFKALVQALKPQLDEIAARNDNCSLSILESIDRDCSLGVLLPSKKGLGVLVVIVIGYLVNSLNTFFETISQINNSRAPDVIDLHKLTPAQLMSIHHENDFLPLIMSTCTHALDRDDEVASVTYDFETLAARVQDRFIKGKTRIDASKLPMVTYKDEIMDADMFDDLEKRITQVELEADIQRVLEQEQQTRLSTIHEQLERLEVAIGFLVFLGKAGDAERKLIPYLKDDLKMDNSNKLDQNLPVVDQHNKCELRHVKHLWSIVAHEKAKYQFKCKFQDPFDGVDKRLSTQLSSEENQAVDMFDELISHMGDKLVFFMHYLYRAILLQFPAEGDTTIQTTPLKLALTDLFRKLGRDPAYLPALTDDRFHEDIRICHSIQMWKRAAKYHQRDSRGSLNYDSP